MSSDIALDAPAVAAARPAKSGFRWIVLTICFLIYLIAGADRANIGVVVPYMKKEFELADRDIGALASLFYIGYSTGAERSWGGEGRSCRGCSRAEASGNGFVIGTGAAHEQASGG